MKTIEWLMMAAFAGGLGLAFYKLYLFFPQTPLADDDTTSEAVEQLTRIMVECDRLEPGLQDEELLNRMMAHRDFDTERFWRFNLNRLRQLAERYRLTDPEFRR